MLLGVSICLEPIRGSGWTAHEGGEEMHKPASSSVQRVGLPRPARSWRRRDAMVGRDATVYAGMLCRFAW